MHSILLQFGSFPPLRTYGLCMALGFLLGWLAAVRLCKRTGQNADALSSLLTWLMLAAVVGARAAYVLEHWSAEFARQPFSVLRVDQGGLMFYGGLIAAALVLVVYTRVYRQHLFQVTDLVLAVVPLGHALGRIGCFMHGCCYGKITSSWIGVCFPRESPAWWEQVSAVPPLLERAALKSLPVIPTQLIEAAANALLFALLATLYPARHYARGFITGCYLIGYALLRFAIEYLRGDPRMAVGPFSISQTISIGLLGLGLFCLAYAKRRQSAPSP
ncbi:MAG TPA: prolipoprotein diacylglyceryl transferase [Kiritimatiellia bacterium]|jgi:phosphatidylglycerol:prolipoprotein diacylglycerol transferase|nr:prolipoprotein diacylglyceryl transferase [Kiritimatiellia bacterium]HQL51632.1 prolipoprotein diacylglyceryl transferase [Kiritimatiellia bacterium]HQQ91517.1 prolipoprotein diacylglyceryl transferase [Kiritimatiellia bacterium]